MAALTLVDLGTPTITSGGGEQTIASLTPDDHFVYVMALDIDALSAAEELDVRCYVDIGGGLRLHSEVTLVSGTDPDLWIGPPTPGTANVDIEWKVVPSGFGANRTVRWILRRA